MIDKVVSVTPSAPTVGDVFLAFPDHKTEKRLTDRFGPKMSKDGKTNLNLKYKIKIGLDPLNNEEHARLIEEITEVEMNHKKENPDDNFISVLKPKVEMAQDGTFQENSEILTLLFTSNDKIPVYEHGEEIAGESLMLTSKTRVSVEFEIRPYSFSNSNGNKIAGISLTPRRIDVIERAPAKSFVRKKKGS